MRTTLEGNQIFLLFLTPWSLDALFSDCPQALTWSVPVGLDQVSLVFSKTRIKELGCRSLL